MKDALFRPVVVLLLASGIAGAAFGQSEESLAGRIAVIEAREEIGQLIIAYGEALDHRNFEAFAELFAEGDGTWVGGFGTATGRDEIFRMMDDAIGHSADPVEPASHHIFANIQIDVRGDRATGKTRWIFVVAAESGDPRWMFLGHYEDEFVRHDGRWYFQRREAFTDIPRQ